MTPCETFIRSLLDKNNFLSTEEFMKIALTHPTFGYYQNHKAIGYEADFITAPEVSQMYGELIGLWCIDLWQQLGSPSPFQLVELGPGRGTLMADIIRVGKNIPNFLEALHIHLVEINPYLMQSQSQAIQHHSISWHTSWDNISLSDNPSIIIANEYFDTQPVRQFIREDNIIYERGLSLVNDQLTWTKNTTDVSFLNSDNEFYEMSPMSESLMEKISQTIKIKKGALLIVDYGYETGGGDSLQGIYQHRYCQPLENIGIADLSCHVNFKQLQKVAVKNDILTTSILSQGQFLHYLGISIRFETLHKNASIKEKALLQASYERLTHPSQMGMLFKAFCAYAPYTLRPAGF